jgi:hypothetical protein
MKSSLKLLGLSVPLFALSFLAAGCYTQLVTMRDDDQSSDRSRYEESRTSDDADTNAVRGLSDYDEDVRGHFRTGFDFYYPSSWYWSFGYGDPYYSGFGFPGYYGYRFNPYGYSYYGYGYDPYYGGYNPYYAYNGYPFVTYGTAGTGYNRSRDAGYRRSGFNRTGGLSGSMNASVNSSLGVSPASRRSSSPVGGSVAPANRRNGTSVNRATTRNSGSGYLSRGRAITSNGSSAPGVKSTPSSGSRAPSNSGPRGSGASRGRGYSGSPGSGNSGNGGGSTRGGAPSGSSRNSSPSYTPAPSSAPSSGGSSGGSRTSGTSRSGKDK